MDFWGLMKVKVNSPLKQVEPESVVVADRAGPCRPLFLIRMLDASMARGTKCSLIYITGVVFHFKQKNVCKFTLLKSISNSHFITTCVSCSHFAPAK